MSGETQNVSESAEGKLANVTKCNVNKTLIRYLIRERDFLPESCQIDFHEQWWLFSEDDSSRDPTLLYAFVTVLM